MNSKNETIQKLQVNLHKAIAKKETTYLNRKKQIRELYPVDAYGIKAEMLIGDLEDRYIPELKELRWYAQAISDLVDMREGGDGKAD